jgi:hypothetical protein
MRRIESIEDDMNGVVRYQLTNGRYVMLDARAVRNYGAAELIRSMGYGALLPTERVRVHERGMTRTTRGPCIGTVPADFDPAFVKSRSAFYDPRPGDFVRDGDVWIVNPMLGPGDLQAIPGFRAGAA